MLMHSCHAHLLAIALCRSVHAMDRIRDEIVTCMGGCIPL